MGNKSHTRCRAEAVLRRAVGLLGAEERVSSANEHEHAVWDVDPNDLTKEASAASTYRLAYRLAYRVYTQPWSWVSRVCWTAI